jgi:hypothetical protein
MPRQDILRHVHQRLSSASRVQRNCRIARRDSLPREQCRTVFPALSGPVAHLTTLGAGDKGDKPDDKSTVKGLTASHAVGRLPTPILKVEHSTMLGDWGIKADDQQPDPKHDLKPTPAFQTMLKPAVDDRMRTDLKPILKPASRYWCATESSCSSAQRQAARPHVRFHGAAPFSSSLPNVVPAPHRDQETSASCTLYMHRRSALTRSDARTVMPSNKPRQRSTV